MAAEGQMITVKGLRAGRHINLEATYRTKCVRAHFMREIRTSGSMRGGRKRAFAWRACLLLYSVPIFNYEAVRPCPGFVDRGGTVPGADDEGIHFA